ncbi:MAG TPA: hypothetical protein VGI43_14250 [Mucilaginibacter sp.]
MKSFISYDGLPISSGGAHHIRSKHPKLIYESLINFLDIYADVLDADAHLELKKFKWSNIIKYSLKFGIPEFDWNNFLANGQKSVRWRVYQKGVDFLIENSSSHQDLRLCILWKFQFVNTITREVLPNQTKIPVIDFRQHNSQLYLRLSQDSSTVSAWFTLPFEDLTTENLNYIDGIRNILPFKLSNKSWRFWTLSKNHHWIPKKISI